MSCTCIASAAIEVMGDRSTLSLSPSSFCFLFFFFLVFFFLFLLPIRALCALSMPGPCLESLQALLSRFFYVLRAVHEGRCAGAWPRRTSLCPSERKGSYCKEELANAFQSTPPSSFFSPTMFASTSRITGSYPGYSKIYPSPLSLALARSVSVSVALSLITWSCLGPRGPPS